MIYVTRMQAVSFRDITFDELFSGVINSPLRTGGDGTSTRTTTMRRTPERLRNPKDVEYLTGLLRAFNERHADLREADRASLYDSFRIPKKSGGYRPIDAPKPELMDALHELKTIFEGPFGALYHTSAFAYVKGRCAVDAVRRHQQNNSRWFCKLDLHNFFGSTTPKFVLDMFSKIYPFSEVLATADGRAAFEQAIDLAFLRGGLPQGTPISPLITNVMMIPVDFALTKLCRDRELAYTRYADDFIISSRVSFDRHAVEKMLTDVLERFSAPFSLNTAKTRYGSSAGSNWNLGVMLNADNEITVGAQRKRFLKSALHNYIMDRRSGVRWPLEDLQHLLGEYSYCRMVERETIDKIVGVFASKFGFDPIQSIIDDIKSL